MENPNQHFCRLCNRWVQNNGVSLDEHFLGRSHLRLEKLEMWSIFFEDNGLFHDLSKKCYICTVCDIGGIPADARKLKQHLLNVHLVGSKKTYSDTLNSLGLWYSGSESPVVFERVHKVRPKIYWATEFDLEEERAQFHEAASPALCVGTGGGSLNFLLVNARFSCDTLRIMTDLAALLEAEGNPTKRGELKRSDHDSRIVPFGMRYAYGDIGRFRHRSVHCYHGADLLATMLCERLIVLFPNVFKHLEDVLTEEGIGEGDNVRLGNTPFTTMCVTKNYHCNIHTDTDDVSYGFFI